MAAVLVAVPISKAEQPQNSGKKGEQLANLLSSYGAPPAVAQAPMRTFPEGYWGAGVQACKVFAQGLQIKNSLTLDSNFSCSDDAGGATCSFVSKDKKGIKGCPISNFASPAGRQFASFQWVPSATITEVYRCERYNDVNDGNKSKVALYLASVEVERVAAAESTRVYGGTKTCLSSAYVQSWEKKSYALCSLKGQVLPAFFAKKSGTKLSYTVGSINGDPNFSSNILNNTSGTYTSVNYFVGKNGKSVGPCFVNSDPAVESYPVEVEPRQYEERQECVANCLR